MTYTPLEELLHSCINFRLSNRSKTKIDGINVLLQEFHQIVAQIEKIAAFRQDFAASAIIPRFARPVFPVFPASLRLSSPFPAFLSFTLISSPFLVFSLFPLLSSPFPAFLAVFPASLRLSLPFPAFLSFPRIFSLFPIFPIFSPYFHLPSPFLTFYLLSSPFLAFPRLHVDPSPPTADPNPFAMPMRLMRTPLFAVSALFLCLLLRSRPLALSTFGAFALSISPRPDSIHPLTAFQACAIVINVYLIQLICIGLFLL